MDRWARTSPAPLDDDVGEGLASQYPGRVKPGGRDRSATPSPAWPDRGPGATGVA